MGRRERDNAYQTELDIKAAVRERDRFQCRKCGMTNEEHVEQTGRALDVHRVFPDSDYHARYCVSLCRVCHGKMPKTVTAAFWRFAPLETGAFFLAWNVFEPENRALYLNLEHLAKARGLTVYQLVDHILEDALKDLPGDYCI